MIYCQPCKTSLKQKTKRLSIIYSVAILAESDFEKKRHGFGLDVSLIFRIKYPKYELSPLRHCFKKKTQTAP